MPDNGTEEDLRFRLGQHEYRVGDLSMNDIAEIEEAYDNTPIGELFESGLVRPLLHMAWCIRRVDEPELTLRDVGAVRLDELIDAGEAAQLPPAVASEDAAESEGDGSHGTSANTASDRGKSVF